MNKYILCLLLSCDFGLSNKICAQRFYDVFDPDLVDLSRLIWEESLTEGDKTCLQIWLNDEQDDVVNQAYIATGVFAEEVKPNLMPCLQGFSCVMRELLQGLIQSANPDSFLLANIPFEIIQKRPKSAHSFIHADEYFVHILLTRFVKAIRAGKNVNLKYLDKLRTVLNESQMQMLDLAYRSVKEWKDQFEWMKSQPDSVSNKTLQETWVWLTYRSTFVEFLSPYYQFNQYTTLSFNLKSFVLPYWIRNLDKIGPGDKEELLKTLNKQDQDLRNNHALITEILLKCLLENCTPDEYRASLEPYSDKEAEARMHDRIKKEMQEKNPAMFKPAPVPQNDSIKAMPRFLRPEDRVHIFDQSSPKELIDFLESNFDSIIYLQERYIFQDLPPKIRAAAIRLGNLANEVSPKQQRKIAGLVNQLIDMGSRPCKGCYEEASILIQGLGPLAIPTLQSEFFSQDKSRIQFASQKLVELKNREIVTWLINVIESSRDEFIKTWSIAILKNMRQYRESLVPGRGLTHEESDQLAKEVIDPYLIEHGIPVKY